LTTDQSASLVRQGEVKRGSLHLEPKAPPNGGGEAPTTRSGVFTSPRIGLLGGSFDPVHRAHIALALAAQQALALDQVRLLPAASPWQREPLTTSGAHRLHMLKLAVAPHTGLCVDPCELERSGKTYTIDTVSQLAPGAHYVWILGSDQLRNFCTWHRWQDIARHVDLAVAQRPDAALEPPPALALHLQSLGRRLAVIPFTPMDVSASTIRRDLAHGLPVHAWLDPSVIAYIACHHLYETPH